MRASVTQSMRPAGAVEPEPVRLERLHRLVGGDPRVSARHALRPVTIQGNSSSFLEFAARPSVRFRQVIRVRDAREDRVLRTLGSRASRQ
jgi:hypothetical protein